MTYRIETTCIGDTEPSFIYSFEPRPHVDIYWRLHEEAFAFCCMAGLEPEEASRKAHIYAIQHTHQEYLEQFA